MQDIAGKLLRSLVLFAVAAFCAGCGQSLVPPLPEMAPFPAGVLSEEQQRKTIDEMIAKKNQQVVDAERLIRDGR